MTQQTVQPACACTPPSGAFSVGSSVHAEALPKESNRWKSTLNHLSLGQGRVFGRDKTDTRTLGIIQLMILNRIKADPQNATARKITDDLSKIFGERIPDAQVFVTLSRLRDRGLVNAVTPEPDQATTNLKGANSSPSETTALPSKSTARIRGRRAAIMKLTPEGVSAVKQAALHIRLSASATMSLKGDCDDTTTTNAAETATLG